MSAHRVIVAAGSPVFHAMLYGNMKESSQKEIELTNIDSSTLKMLLSFIYSGHVRTNLMDCVELLRAADYFDIKELKTMCLDMVKEKLFDIGFDDLIYNITTLAIRYQLDSLLDVCVTHIEIHIEEVIDCSWFGSLPLSVLTVLVKSSNLEVRELDLFLAVAEWCKQQHNGNDDDIKPLFKQIRYPLIPRSHLIEKVLPTNMADPDLYKAALEYHDTDKFDGSEDQLKLRRYYFDFEPTDDDNDDDIRIEHTAKGTLITNDGPATFVTCEAGVRLRYLCDIPFTFCLKSCQNKHRTLLKLYDIFDSDQENRAEENVVDLPIGEEVQGVISHERDEVKAQIGDVVLYTNSPSDECCEFSIKLYIGDQVHILRT